MVSTYTNLGVQKMATGEKAGTWGTLTNTNWDIMEQIAGGYVTQALTSGGTVTLTKNDGTTGAVLATRLWKLTGALSDNAIVTVPDSIENWWLVDNGSTNAYTVQIKTVSGTGPTWSTTDKGTKLIYTDGTNVIDVMAASSGITLANTNALLFNDADDSAAVGFKAPTTVSGAVTWVLPAADATTSGYALTSDAAGTLSWAAAGISTGKAIAMAMIFG
jgi:hypothetical protein